MPIEYVQFPVGYIFTFGFGVFRENRKVVPSISVILYIYTVELNMLRERDEPFSLLSRHKSFSFLNFSSVFQFRFLSLLPRAGLWLLKSPSSFLWPGECLWYNLWCYEESAYIRLERQTNIIYKRLLLWQCSKSGLDQISQIPPPKKKTKAEVS